VPPVGSDASEDTLGVPNEPDPDGPADDPDAVSTPIDDAPRAPGLG
jgi:hypothetical protein